MRSRNFDRFRPGQQEISASELNRLQESVERMSNPVGIGVQVSAGGTSFLEKEEPWLYAKITERNDDTSPSRYSWQAVMPDSKGRWIDDIDGARFTFDQYPAYEANEVQAEPPFYTILYKGEGNWCYFFSGTSGDVKVKPLSIIGPAVSGRYPAQIDYRDENTPDWYPVDPPQIVWAIPYNPADTLTEGRRYKGLYVSVNPADNVPVYAVQEAMGGSGGRSLQFARAYLSTTQNIPPGQQTKVRFDYASIDDVNNPLFDGSTNEIVIRFPSTFLVGYNLQISATAIGTTVASYIYADTPGGSFYVLLDEVGHITSPTHILRGTALVQLEVNSRVGVRFTDSGVGGNFSILGGPQRPELSTMWVSEVSSQ